MTMISVEGVSKTLLETALFENVTFTLEAGVKAGMVGPNGAGKSTLLAILARQKEADEGTLTYKRDIDIVTLEQKTAYKPNQSVQSFLFDGEGKRIAAYNAYHTLLNVPHTQAELTAALQTMEAYEGWTLLDQYTSLLGELGLQDILETPMERLSGGMQKKVALARLFCSAADLMLLDEPTNHLDIPTIEWLETKLKANGATVIAVTHDRAFLDALCHTILELDGTTLYVHPAPFATFLQRRDERLRNEAKHQERIKTILKRELAWLKRGPKARTSKDSGRIDRINELLVEQEVRPTATVDSLIPLTRRLGKKILEAQGLGKRFGEQQVIKNFSFTFDRGCKIGVIGPNGSGKTTLLDLLSQSIPADEGSLDIGVNTHFGYLRQTDSPFAEEDTILDAIEDIAEFIPISAGEVVSAAKFLDLYGFPPAMHRKSIATLSGGERRRLSLVRTLMQQPNFLLLDEPTNDLDLAMMENLEEYLSSYGGCLLVSSHDRAFLDLVCDELFVLDGSSTVSYHTIGYSAYQELAQTSSKQESERPVARAPQRQERRRLSNYEEKELLRLEEELGQLGADIVRLEESFATTHPTEDGTIEERTQAYHEKRKQLKACEAAWLVLAERA